MANPRKTLEADVVIVGSGPGGATMAREMTKKGKKVILCEAGRRHQRFGYTLFLLSMMDGFGLTFSKEGTWVIRPKTVGGASVVFSGTAIKPPAWMKEKYGLDLREEVDELYREIPIQPLPDRLVGPAARKIMEAAQGIGLDWKLLDKWIRPEHCLPNCGQCSLGCRVQGAKWTAREFVEEAREKGAELLMNTRVDRLLVEGGKAEGVRAKSSQGWVDIMAEKTILSAGGQGTPPILQRAGLDGAGQGFFADPLWFVSGAADTQGSIYDIPMSAGINLFDEGIVMTDHNLPPMMYTALLAYSGFNGITSMPEVAAYKKTLTIMIKVRDGLEGRIYPDGTFSKPIDGQARKKLDKGAALAEEILVNAGVKRNRITRTCVNASHPGGTTRIGHVLDENCQTSIQNCYCMDTSIIPEPWGLPPTVTVVALAKRLARHLTAP